MCAFKSSPPIWFFSYKRRLKPALFKYIDAAIPAGPPPIIATSCNNGNIIIRGPAKVVDNSTGGTIDTTHVVNPYRFADQTWDEAVASHVTTDTMGAALRDSKDESIGKWEVDPDTHVLKMYRSDGVTVLASFTLATSGTDVPAYVSRTPM